MVAPVNLVEVLNSRGTPTGSVCMQHEAHREGWWHREARLCVTNGPGYMLEVQRCAQRHREMWDPFLVSGDVWVGESPPDAIRRMAFEQFGSDFTAILQECPLYEVCRVPCEGEVSDASYPSGCYRHKVRSNVFVAFLSGLDERVLTRETGIPLRRYPKWQLREDLGRPEYSRVFTQHAHHLPPERSVRLYNKILLSIA